MCVSVLHIPHVRNMWMAMLLTQLGGKGGRVVNEFKRGCLLTERVYIYIYSVWLYTNIVGTLKLNWIDLSLIIKWTWREIPLLQERV